LIIDNLTTFDLIQYLIRKAIIEASLQNEMKELNRIVGQTEHCKLENNA
jgi:hypothetical protein